MSRIHSALFLVTHPFLAGEAVFFLLQTKIECKRLVPKELTDRYFHADSSSSINRASKSTSCARMISLIGRKFLHSTCLHKSLALCRMLKRRNIAYTLIVGIDKNKNARQLAHAWVEACGYTFAWGTKLENYTELKEVTVSKENLL